MQLLDRKILLFPIVQGLANTDKLPGVVGRFCKEIATGK